MFHRPDGRSQRRNRAAIAAGDHFGAALVVANFGVPDEGSGALLG